MRWCLLLLMVMSVRVKLRWIEVRERGEVGRQVVGHLLCASLELKNWTSEVSTHYPLRSGGQGEALSDIREANYTMSTHLLPRRSTSRSKLSIVSGGSMYKQRRVRVKSRGVGCFAC